MKQCLLLFILVSISTSINAQLKKSDLRLDYNPETSHYDVYFIVKEGSATTALDRTHASAQISFNVPKGADAEIKKAYNPIKGNTVSGSDDKPQTWYINATVESPGITPERDYFTVETPWTPVSRYNNLSEGDSVKLFSISIDTDDPCSIRLFDNENDPGPLDAGFFGADFSNTIIIGGSTNSFNKVKESLVVPEGCETTTNTNDLELEKITLWPNPSSNIVHVNNIPSDSHLQIYDINGQLLKTISEVGSTAEINISSWKTGTYFLKVENKESRYIKFQKQ